MSSSKGSLKRKWGEHGKTSFSVEIVGCSSSSSRNDATALITISSSKETDEDYSLDLNSVFLFRYEKPKSSCPRKPAKTKRMKSQRCVNVEFRLPTHPSIGPTNSAESSTNFCIALDGGQRSNLTGTAKLKSDLRVHDTRRINKTENCTCNAHGIACQCKATRYNKEVEVSVALCKSEGGRTMCSWGHPGSQYHIQLTVPCNSFASSATGLCVLHNGLVEDKPVRGGVAHQLPKEE